jgi:hypothetical protein
MLNLPLQGAHRILHIHNNIPGILERLDFPNYLLMVSIFGQSLKTNDNIGYVVLDIDTRLSNDVHFAEKCQRDYQGQDALLTRKTIFVKIVNIN